AASRRRSCSKPSLLKVRARSRSENRSTTDRVPRLCRRVSALPSGLPMPRWSSDGARKRTAPGTGRIGPPPSNTALERDIAVRTASRSRDFEVDKQVTHPAEPSAAIEFLPPDRSVLARRPEILAGLAALVPPASLIVSDRELAPFETDAFTAVRNRPLAVVLPETTAQVAALMSFLARENVPVVPRGAGTSLSGGAIPEQDAVVIGLSKMRRILEIDLPNRAARVQAGVTNLAISEAVAADGFFYAPDPSSQLACTIGGNIGMNSGGAHCLKYGVTTNNLLGVTMVLPDGEVIELGGKGLDGPG